MLLAMVLLEMSITPLGKGESVSQYVAECVELVDRAASITSCTRWARSSKASWTQVLDLMRRCIEQVAKHSDRVTCCRQARFPPRPHRPPEKQSRQRRTKTRPRCANEDLKCSYLETRR